MRWRMPAFSAWAPYPHLIAAGIKFVECRSQPTSVRGDVAVHVTQISRVPDEHPAWTQLGGKPQEAAALYPGHVIAVATLVDCVPIIVNAGAHPPVTPCIEINGAMATLRRSHRPAIDLYGQRELGRFDRPGWGYLLDCVRVLERPIPVRGSQAIWRLPEEATLDVLAQVR